MDRSLYNDGVPVDQTDLSNTENTKSQQILRRYVDANTGGVVTGLLVTISIGNTSLVNVAAGRGYAPNGESVEIVAAINNISLSDYTVGVRNFVCLVYTETFNKIKPHETSGNSFPTRANHSARMVVLTETQYLALPQTLDNFGLNDKDRSLVVAIVTSPGPATAITTSNIALPSQFTGGVSAIKSSNNITGVTVVRISSTTTTGTGTLSFTQSSGVLTWVAPSDSSGTPVVVSAGGIFSLTSLPSNTTLRVNVQSILLPISNQADSITITNIYTQDVASSSAQDLQHRSFVGSGVPTPNNPHGLTPGDLGVGETQTESHQKSFHSSGLIADSAATALASTVNTGGVPHSLSLTALGATDRLVAGGFIHTTTNAISYLLTNITANAHMLLQFFAVTGSGSGIAALERRERIRYLDIPPPALASVAQLADCSSNMGSGAGQIQYATSPSIFRFKAPGDGSFGPDVAIPNDIANSTPRFVRLWNNNSTKWLDIYVVDPNSVQGATLWGAVTAVIEDLTFATPPTSAELYNRHLLHQAPFSGASTGFLGFGFGTASAPNMVLDRRQFGNTGTADFQNDLYETKLARFPVRRNGAHFQLAPTNVFPTGMSIATGSPATSPDDGTLLMYRDPASGVLTPYFWNQNVWTVWGSRKGYIPLDLFSTRIIAANVIQNTIEGGTPDGNTDPSVQRINGATNRAIRVIWAASSVVNIQFAPVAFPPDIDDAQSMDICFLAAMSGATDTPSINVQMTRGISGTNSGGNATPAVTGTSLAKYTFTIPASGVDPYPQMGNIVIAPSSIHSTDALHLYAAWIEYTRKF